jgi:ribonuclease PH
VTGKGGFVEVQGTAENKAFTREQLDRMTAAAVQATARLKEIQTAVF